MSDRDLTRRSLLMAGGAGFLAAALPTVGLSPAAAATTGPAPATPLAPPDKQPPHLDVPQHPHQKLRWAIVGLGELALAEVLPAFAQSEHARVTALVSGHPDKVRKVADYYGVDPKHLYTYDNYDAIAYDDQIDIVYIILPNHMHAEYTIRALKAGMTTVAPPTRSMVRIMATRPVTCDAGTASTPTSDGPSSSACWK